jgi:hypothetical protein
MSDFTQNKKLNVIVCTLMVKRCTEEKKLTLFILNS